MEREGEGEKERGGDEKLKEGGEREKKSPNLKFGTPPVAPTPNSMKIDER